MTTALNPDLANAQAPAFDPAAVRAWLQILHGNSPGRVSIVAKGNWTGGTFTDLDQATAYVQQLDATGTEGIYCRVTTIAAQPPAGSRAGAADSVALPALWADLDLAGPGHSLWCATDCAQRHPHRCPRTCRVEHEHVVKELPPDEDAGRAVIAATGLPEPSVWIHSGGGLYPIWLLDQPYVITADSLDATKRLAKDWQAVIERAAGGLGWHYGTGVGDLARVLRIPGTVNRKEGLARPCRLLTATTTRYSLQQLVDAVTAATPAPPEPARESPASSRAAGGGVSPLDDYAARTTWPEILEPAGWKEHYRNGDVVYWTRPGKDTDTSATTNALGTDRLHVFTDATDFTQGENYSKGGAYAVLHHGGDHSAAARDLASRGFGTPTDAVWPLATAAPAWATTAGLIDATEPEKPAARPALDVGNAAVMADWLRVNIGTGALAGMFVRGPDIVHTPREGEDGYVPLHHDPGDSDGPAQVRVARADYIAARVQYTFGCYKLAKRGEDYEPVPALFPTAAAKVATNAVDMLPNLRRLKGVVHTPVFRADGSLVDAPGYDSVTRLLYLPEPGLVIPAVSARPSAGEVRASVGLVDEMLQGFPFTSAHGRANYIGALITPLLRAIAPPPYKLVAIGAHQRGSGKTKLGNLPRIIHGGVFRSETPEDDAELRKQVTSILAHTTGPVIVFDNVSGVLRSSTLAGLLTSDEWGDRPLGATEWVGVPNDRLWIVTGNNLALGGDIPRRTITTEIDPGVPRPELRTGFAIGDPEVWAKNRRGDLLHALLTIVQAWVAAGRPLPPERASDGYARWTRTLEGILTHAGIEGIFDHSSTQIEVGTDDDEWGDFLAAIYRVRGDRPWMVKELLADVSHGGSYAGIVAQTKPIPLDALPSELADKASRSPHGPAGVARPLGMWLRNRNGRWAGNLAVRSAGKDRDGAGLWRIQVAPGHPGHSTAGTAGTAGTNSLPRARVLYEPNTVSSGVVENHVRGAPDKSPQSPQSPHLPNTPADLNRCARCAQRFPDAAWSPCDRCGTRTHARGRGSHGPTCATCLNGRTTQ